MLDVILQILSVIGIVLLVLLGVVLVVLLLVLFFPITYKFYGSKSENIVAKFKAKWLFGFLRICYEYPETATFSVKILWHTLYCMKFPRDEENTDVVATVSNEKEKETEGQNTLSGEVQESSEEVASAENTASKSDTADVVSDTEDNPSAHEITENEMADEDSQNKILKKIEKIKYTIRNIYDKIKEIWENITYYVELLKEDNTKELFHHVTIRVGKILKSIRPRHLKADILFGTGSPDTTGYAYGVYGMLSSVLGPKFLVEPDFEQAVLKGEIQFSGHITIWVLLINALKLFFDPKLHLFIKKIKAGMPKKQNSSGAVSAERG